MLVLTAILAAAALGQKKDELIPAVPTDLATAAYPFVAIESGVSGQVHVEVDINTKGRVTAARVLSGPGFTCPDVKNVAVVAIRNAATEAAMKTKYKPARLNGKAVVSTARLMFGFTPPQNSSSDNSPKIITVGTWEPDDSKVNGNDAKSDAGSTTTDARILTVKGKKPATAVLGNPKVFVKPIYPAAAARLGVKGMVEVKVLIDTDGSVLSAEALDGHPLLKPGAVTAACSSTFHSTQLSGQPVKVSGIIRYSFKP